MMIPLNACYIFWSQDHHHWHNSQKNDKINKTFNSNKKCNFLPVKNIVLLTKRRSCTRNGRQPQTTKLQSANYFANTDGKFQHTLRHKAVKLRINIQTNHVRQKEFRLL